MGKLLYEPSSKAIKLLPYTCVLSALCKICSVVVKQDKNIKTLTNDQIRILEFSLKYNYSSCGGTTCHNNFVSIDS